VTMEDIARDMSLHSVGDEKKSIQDLRTCVSIHTTTLSSTTSTEVLGQLPNHDIVSLHCAFHGFSDTLNPSNSHLILQDTGIAVETVVRKKAASAQPAYSEGTLKLARLLKPYQNQLFFTLFTKQQLYSHTRCELSTYFR